MIGANWTCFSRRVGFVMTILLVLVLIIPFLTFVRCFLTLLENCCQCCIDKYFFASDGKIFTALFGDFDLREFHL